MSMKNPMTPAGIEPATYRSVAQLRLGLPTLIPQLGSRFGSVKFTPGSLAWGEKTSIRTV